MLSVNGQTPNIPQWPSKSSCSYPACPRTRQRLDANFHSTGVTGYIGGDALYALHSKHPEYEYTALVRTQEKADKVTAKFPDVRIVIGANEDSHLIREEASKADVVLRMHVYCPVLFCSNRPQTPQTRRITRALQRLSPPVWPPGIPHPNLATGSIVPAPAF